MPTQISPTATTIERKPAYLTFAVNHEVPLYSVNGTALSPLTDYVEACLLNGETCIIVGTPPYLYELGEELRAKSLDLHAAKKKGQYITICPQRVSKTTGDNQLPASTLARLLKTVKALAKNSERPVQIFSEEWLSGYLLQLA